MDILLERVYDSATTTYAKAFITYIRVTVPATSVLAVDVFGTCIVHRHLVPGTGTSLIAYISLVFRLSLIRPPQDTDVVNGLCYEMTLA
jgi:hypothetical protein